MTAKLPRIVCSSVVRSVHQGESHGGVYLVDLATGDIVRELVPVVSRMSQLQQR